MGFIREGNTLATFKEHLVDNGQPLATTEWNGTDWGVRDLRTGELVVQGYDSSIEAEYDAEHKGYEIVNN